MIPEHKNVFFVVAAKFRIWIGVREFNELSTQWVGNPNCVSKEAYVSAKTVDNVKHPLCGLVVSPKICPTAFLDQLNPVRRPDGTVEVPRSTIKWEKFLKHDRVVNNLETIKLNNSQKNIHDWTKINFDLFGLQKEFVVIEGGSERVNGLVLQNRKAIHADYDIMNIVPAGPNGEMLPDTSSFTHSLHFAQRNRAGENIGKTRDEIESYYKDYMDNRNEFWTDKIFPSVHAMLNDLFMKTSYPAKMVTHSTEFQWYKFVGCAANETVFWFGPNGPGYGHFGFPTSMSDDKSKFH